MRDKLNIHKSELFIMWYCKPIHVLKESQSRGSRKMVKQNLL